MQYKYIYFGICSQWKTNKVAIKNLHSRLKIQASHGSGMKVNIKENRRVK